MARVTQRSQKPKPLIHSGNAGMKSRVTLYAAMAALAGAGCASLPADLGQQGVNALTAERGRALPDQSASPLIEKLSQEPLNRDSAVALALANNPELALRF